MRSGLEWDDAETDDADFPDPALAVLSRPMVGTPGESPSLAPRVAVVE
jgi:hypothetical protein